MKKLTSILIAMFSLLNFANAQADFDINILMQPAFLPLNQSGNLNVRTVNNGDRNIVSNSLRIKITVGTNAEITGLAQVTDARWTVQSLTAGTNNTITLTNSNGTMGFPGATPGSPSPAADINIVVKGTVEGGPSTITGTIGYISATNPLIDGAQNSSQGNTNTSNDNSTTSLTVSAGGTTPITLVDFTATKQDKYVNLNWQTSIEQNSSHFDVEFSTDGIKFESIGKVNAAGNSNSVKNYALTHTKPVNGANYYRLKLVDIDASFKYSPVRAVKFSTSKSITVLPNPTVERVFITSNEGGMLQSVGVYALNGKLLQVVNNFALGKSIDLSNYAPSIYILKLIDKEGNSEVIKVVKK